MLCRCIKEGANRAIGEGQLVGVVEHLEDMFSGRKERRSSYIMRLRYVLICICMYEVISVFEFYDKNINMLIASVLSSIELF